MQRFYNPLYQVAYTVYLVAYSLDLVDFTVILFSLCSLRPRNRKIKYLTPIYCSVLEGLTVKIKT